MANIYTYWDPISKELINFTTDHVERKGGRIEIALDDTHGIFKQDVPSDIYKMNDTDDDIELKP